MLSGLGQKSLFYHIITAVQVVIDAFTVLAAFLLAHYIWVHWFRTEGHIALPLLVPPFRLALCILLFVFLQVGLYKEEKSLLNIEETQNILKGVFISALIMIAAAFFLQNVRPLEVEQPHPGARFVENVHSQFAIDSELSRWLVLLGFFLTFFFMSIQRYFMFKLHQRLHELGLGNQRVALYGMGPMSLKLRAKLKQSPKLGYTMLGFIKDPDHEEPNSEDNLRILGTFDDLPQLIEELQIEKLIIAMSAISPERMTEIMTICEQKNCAFEFVPTLYSLFLHNIEFTTIEGIPLISIRRPRYRLFYRLTKRLFDLVVGGLFTLTVLLPSWIILGLLIKRDSPGPVLFTQERIGKDGKSFLMYKFRTMHSEVDPYEVTPENNKDARITKVGKWLRRTSVDELPQLLNVLIGNMSLVGPRPEMPFIVKQYTAFERERLVVKPGITGVWQISADRKKQIHANMDYDLFYIERQSILLDIVILIRTLVSTIVGIGAY